MDDFITFLERYTWAKYIQEVENLNRSCKTLVKKELKNYIISYFNNQLSWVVAELMFLLALFTKSIKLIEVTWEKQWIPNSVATVKKVPSMNLSVKYQNKL